MVKEKKMKCLSEEDVKIIESDPSGLADYVVYSKVKEARKTMLILAVIAMAATFAAGAICGSMLAKSSVPNNVVQVQLGSDNEQAEVKPEGK